MEKITGAAFAFSVSAPSSYIGCTVSPQDHLSKGRALLLPRQIRWKGIEEIWWRIVGTVLQRHDVMRGEWHLGMQRRGDGPSEGLAIDVDLPAGLLIERRRKAELGKAVMPDGQEIIEGLVVLLLRGLDVQNAIARVGVQPVQATPIRSDADPFGDSDPLSVHVDREMRVNMVATLLHPVAGHPINRRVGGVEGHKRLDLKVDEADESKEDDATSNRAP
jgi:hypothetical protein